MPKYVWTVQMREQGRWRTVAVVFGGWAEAAAAVEGLADEYPLWCWDRDAVCLGELEG